VARLGWQNVAKVEWATLPSVEEQQAWYRAHLQVRIPNKWHVFEEGQRKQQKKTIACVF
jgi:hypothetical protein